MKQILVVDDEPTIREVVANLLQDEGYQVETAGNGAEALDRLSAARADLVLLDIMMPAVDGYETLQKMQDRPDLDGLPVVLMSAAGRPSRPDPRVWAFLPKPFDLDRLLAVVREIVGSELPPKGADR